MFDRHERFPQRILLQMALDGSPATVALESHGLELLRMERDVRPTLDNHSPRKIVLAWYQRECVHRNEIEWKESSDEIVNRRHRRGWKVMYTPW